MEKDNQTPELKGSFEQGSRNPADDLSEAALLQLPPADLVGIILKQNAQLSALEKERDELSKIAIQDPLTGLFNRRYFDRMLLASCMRPSLTPAGNKSDILFIMDCDRFKAVNDTLGHAAGDDALKQVAARLREVFRANEIILRNGGDEFAVIARGMTREVAFDRRAQIEAMEPLLVSANGRTLEVGLSIGLGMIGPEEQFLEANALARAAAVERTADGDMYRRKAMRKTAAPKSSPLGFAP